MINEYIVEFRKGGNDYKLHISAHDKDEAIKLAEMQSKFSKMGNGKFIFQSIRGIDEKYVLEEIIDKHTFFITVDKKQEP